MNDNICRWGILGTAGIAKKNWQSIYNAGNARLVAVASRNTDRAQAYVDECQAQVAFNPPPRAVGSYEGVARLHGVGGGASVAFESGGTSCVCE